MIWAGQSGGLVEDCLTLDLAALMRLAPRLDGQVGHGSLSWRVDDEVVGSAWVRIDLRSAETAQLVIAFACGGEDGGKRRVVAQRVRLAFTVPQFGGRRWWMICPVTGDRVRCLHLPPAGDRFACRKAWNLSYRMERLGRLERSFEQLARHQRRLCGVATEGAVPVRPKGMWQRTYDRNLRRLAALDEACGAAILGMIGVPCLPAAM